MTDNLARIIDPFIFADERGTLVKVFNKFSQDSVWEECFYTTSKKGVLRGMHFQKGADKLIWVLKGKIRQVTLNLATGDYKEVILSALNHKVCFVPDGFAHGFYSISDSVVCYLQSKTYDKETEGGVKYDSFGYNWKRKPLISKRDESFPAYTKI